MRWPPQDLQEFAPDVFVWDAATNRLSLREEHHATPPWKAQPHHRRSDQTDLWLYCKDCDGPTAKEGAIPFRDALSMQFCRDLDTSSLPSESSQSLETLTPQAQVWKEATDQAARKNVQRGKRLSFQNLVPAPEPCLWQSTPEAPLRKLQSEPARAALACCNLDSSMVEGQDERGRAAYACVVGDTAIWRGQPHQLQSTLAFMLCKDEGRLYRVPAAEFDDVHKCQTWLPEK